jgi:hypothetical protein
MKKILTVGLAGLLAASLLSPASAGAPTKQTEEGTVVAPLPFMDDSGCFAGVHRRMAIVTQEMVNGVGGYHFDVDPATYGGKFKMEPTGGIGDVDLDIYFYSKFGTIDDVVGDPGGAGAPFTVQFNTREPGGEVGVVPADTTKVIVCMYGGQMGAGAGATFTYEAVAPVKKKKKK